MSNKYRGFVPLKLRQMPKDTPIDELAYEVMGEHTVKAGELVGWLDKSGRNPDDVGLVKSVYYSIVDYQKKRPYYVIAGEIEWLLSRQTSNTTLSCLVVVSGESK